MFPDDTLSVAFGEHQIQIRSNAPEVLAGLGKVFCAMQTENAAAASEQVEILKDEDHFELRLNDHHKNITAQSIETILLQAEHEIVTWLIRKSPELIWFHAGAAAYQQRATLFAGKWGQGKSALVTTLCQKGWKYLSDEVIPINPQTDELLPFPQMPKVRTTSDNELPEDEVRDIKKIELSLELKKVVRTPLPVEAIIFPKYVHHTDPQIVTVSPATAVLSLIENCLNFDTHSTYALTYLSELCQRIPTLCLQYNNRKLAAELILNRTDYQRPQNFFQRTKLTDE